MGDLGGTSGAATVGADAVTGAPHALGAGSVGGHITALLGYLDDHESAASDAHPAAAIAYADGPAWLGGRANPATMVQGQIDKLVGHLGDQTDNDDGARRIGAQAVTGSPTSLPAGSVRSHIDALLALANRAGLIDQANTWAAPQAFQGTASGIEPARHVTSTPWERENSAFYAARLLLARSDVRYQQVDTSTPLTFTEGDWSGTAARVFALDVTGIGTGQQVACGRERDVSAGPLTGYSAAQGEWGSTNVNIGGGASFASGRLPATPSSVTFTVKQQAGTDGSPSAFAADRMGVGWFDSTTGSLPGGRFMFLTFSAT